MVVLARRLGFLSALRAPPFLLPDPDLSETLREAAHLLLAPLLPGGDHDLRRIDTSALGDCLALLRTATGRRRIPRCLEPV